MTEVDLAKYFNSAKFTESAAKFSQCPSELNAEIAFAGRSNAGKSSAINALTNHKKLARTSKTPGRTQLINFFVLGDQCSLVDLPGYGYAKVAQGKKLAWQRELHQYLENRRTLKGLILLTDIRHAPAEYDRSMIDWAEASELPVHIVLTKSDKLSRGAAKTRLLTLQQQFCGYNRASVQLFSAMNGNGLDELRANAYRLLHG